MEKFDKTADQIHINKSFLRELESQVATLEGELEATRERLAGVKASKTDPKAVVAAEKKRADLRLQVKALEDAISQLKTQAQATKQEIKALQERQQNEEDEAALEDGRALARELAQEGSEIVAALETWLHKVEQLQGLDDIYRRKLRRELPPRQSFPSESHYSSALLRAGDRKFLEGIGEWSLPELVQDGENLQLQRRVVDIRPPRPKFSSNFGGNAGGSSQVRPLKDVIRTIPADELKGLSPAARYLRTQGFSGPDAVAIAEGRKLPSEATPATTSNDFIRSRGFNGPSSLADK